LQEKTMSIGNFFLVPSGLNTTTFVTGSVNAYQADNGIVINGAAGVIGSLIN
jgi:hypothetical protein